jgi:hypothetical protein
LKTVFLVSPTLVLSKLMISYPCWYFLLWWNT